MRTTRARTGERPRDLAVWVGPVNLLGVQVSARALLNSAEHERRSALGLGPVTDPALLDCLLALPTRRPAYDPVLWAETSALPGGIVDHGDDECTVTRLLEPSLVVDDVIVPGAHGRVLRAVQDASLFAGFTRRWVWLEGTAGPDTAVLEAKLCGVGLVSPHGRVILSAEPPTLTTADGWTWLLAEKTYRRWLRQTGTGR